MGTRRPSQQWRLMRISDDKDQYIQYKYYTSNASQVYLTGVLYIHISLLSSLATLQQSLCISTNRKSLEVIFRRYQHGG